MSNPVAADRGGRTMQEPEQEGENRYAAEREALVRSIEAELAERSGAYGLEELDPRVANALRRVPRHQFMPASERRIAYVDHAQPIGFGQTISQPFVVAVMTDLLRLEPDHIVLEVGTGSGYQAAVLAELARHVYSVELIEELADSAREQLQALGYRNVDVKCGDGARGWAEHGPFDRIIVTAAAEGIPPALLNQLRPGGRLVIPVGRQYETQWLTLITKDEQGTMEEHRFSPVAFVPLRHRG